MLIRSFTILCLRHTYSTTKCECRFDFPNLKFLSSGFVRNAWHHGGPTAPFIHLVSAFCFIIPKVFMEAKLIEVGFLANGEHFSPHIQSKNVCRSVLWPDKVTAILKLFTAQIWLREGLEINCLMLHPFLVQFGFHVSQLFLQFLLIFNRLHL